MVQFDNQYRQVKLKVVYYGPGLCGKTTCLQYIHRVSDPGRRTKLYALNTASDRTLFFDLLGLDLGRVRGYKLMLQLYTVPGQVQYNATRRAVLAGADGVVFVADSQRACAQPNQESFANLLENLKANGLDTDSIPLVFHYNKRDLPEVLARAELDALLNLRKAPAFETVATTGGGVMEGFSAVAEATVLSVADRLGLAGQSEAVNRILANVRAALAPLLPKQAAAAVEAPVLLRTGTKGESLGADELVGEAVRANAAMAELNVRLDRITKELERQVASLHAMSELGQVLSSAREPEEVTGATVDRLLAELRVNCGSLLLSTDGELVSVLRRGMAADPIARAGTAGTTAAQEVINGRKPVVVRFEELEPAAVTASPWFSEADGIGFVSVIAAPLVVRGDPVGVLTAYADANRGAFDDQDLQLASVMASNAAVALANSRAWRALEELNRSLEGTVAERTRELQQALGESERLAGQLEERNLALETANWQLKELEKLKGDLLDRIAHELNTPVTSIQTAARILSRYGEVPPDKAAKFVEIITQESGRLASLIASALQATVLGVAEGQPRLEEVPLHDLLRRVLAPFREEIGQFDIKVQVKLATGLDRVVGDPQQLEAALAALVKNAIEFNRPGGALTVTARPVRRGAAGMIELRVEDTGQGISDADLPHVCDVFWQGGNVLTEKPRGLGLGLAVAKRVAEKHGGRLEIASEIGKGTAVALLIETGATPQAAAGSGD